MSFVCCPLGAQDNDEYPSDILLLTLDHAPLVCLRYAVFIGILLLGERLLYLFAIDDSTSTADNVFLRMKNDLGVYSTKYFVLKT